MPSATPGSSSDIAQWARANLFQSRINVAMTLVLAVILALIGYKLLRWGLVDAVFRPDPQSCRAASGACWGFVVEKLRLMTFATYPYDQQWRPLGTSLLLIGMVVATLSPGLWGRRLAAAWIVALPAMWVLMRGGTLSFSIRLLAVIAVIAGGVAGMRSRRLQTSGQWLGFGAVVAVLLVAVWRLPLRELLLPTGLPRVETEQWGGLPLTLILAAVGIVLSFPLAVMLALGRRSELPAIRALCVGYIELVRGVPLITVLFMASLMIPLFLPEGMNIDKVLRAQIGFILFAAAYEAEVIRGGLQSLPKGQYEAADALGLSYWQKMGFIILPQALKTVIPPMVNTFIGFFKDTSLVIIIGLYDLLGAVRLASLDVEWRQFYIEGLVFLGLVYFAFCYSMAAYSRRLEARLSTAHR